jgi:Lon protease-like protein
VSETSSIQVNFGRAMPLFPLPNVALLPQQVQPFHVFEPRYRQMVETALDGAGQLAMAVFEGDRWKREYHARPPLKPAVCVGQIIHHEKTPDGRFTIALQGVCRARIILEMPPSHERLYRTAMLQPVGLPSEEDQQRLADARERISERLADGPLRRLKAAGPISEYFGKDDFPTAALMELISFTILNDADVRYSLLSEADALERARIIERELAALSRVIAVADRQWPTDAPRGCSWN